MPEKPEDNIQAAFKCMKLIRNLNTKLQKAKGEGSRGGKVTGHTKSGKAIYGSPASKRGNSTPLAEKPAPKPKLQTPHKVDIQYEYNGKSYSHQIPIQAQHPEHAQEKAREMIKIIEKKLGHSIKMKRLDIKKISALDGEEIKKGGKGSGRKKNLFYFNAKITEFENKIRQAKKEGKNTEELEAHKHYFEVKKRVKEEEAASRVKTIISSQPHIIASMQKANEVETGTKIEMEHAGVIKKIIQDVKKKNPKATKKYAKMIAEDHIKEFKNYYSLLVKMEKKAEKKLNKSDLIEIINLLKGGKKAEIGEQRTWSNGNYVKHADGWVKLGGKHHGKLMGKFKTAATHKEFADSQEIQKDTKIESTSAPHLTGMKTASLDVITRRQFRDITPGKKSAISYIPAPGDKSNMVGFVAFGKANKNSQKILNEKLQTASLILTEMGVRFKTPIDFTCQNVSAKAQKATLAIHYELRRQGRNSLIDIKSDKEGSKTLLHEIGHNVDWSLGEGARDTISTNTFEHSPALIKKLEAIESEVKNSPFYKTADNYLLKKKEIFARAFEVYAYQTAKKMASEGKIKSEFLEGFVPDVLKPDFSWKAFTKWMNENLPEDIKKLKEKVKASQEKSNKAFDKVYSEISEAEKVFVKEYNKIFRSDFEKPLENIADSVKKVVSKNEFKKSELIQLLNLFKSRPHKYIRKIGSGKNTRYIYKDSEKSPTKTITSTAEKYKTPDGKYLIKREMLHSKIINERIEKVKPAPKTEKPIAILTGGGSGSGKTGVLKEAHKVFQSEMVHVDSDDIKAEIPEYQEMVKAHNENAAAFAHVESSELASELINKSMESRKSFALDSTMSDFNKMEKMVKTLKSKGYKVHLFFADVSVEIAKARAVKRAKTTGRKVPNEVIEGSHKGAISTLGKLSKLVDSTSVYSTEGYPPKLIYQNSEGVTFKDPDNFKKMKEHGHMLKAQKKKPSSLYERFLKVVEGIKKPIEIEDSMSDIPDISKRIQYAKPKK